MEWDDDGIILGVRKHGETSAIVETMTRKHGRHLGLVRGGRSKRMQPVLQPGNSISINWRARLDEHLGSFQIEPLKMRAAELMASAMGVHGIQAMAAQLRFLPERDPHEALFDTFDIILNNLTDPVDAGELYIRFELALLNELGFGLDLDECAATGQTTDLVYISPKSGRAVSKDAGAPWKDKMFKFPEFLGKDRATSATADSLIEAFKITHFFFDQHIYTPRGVIEPLSRQGFMSAIMKQLDS